VLQETNVREQQQRTKISYLNSLFSDFFYTYFSWIDCVRNEEVLQRVKDERNILQEVKRRKINQFGHMLRRNCLLKLVSEGNIEGRSEGKTRKNT